MKHLTKKRLFQIGSYVARLFAIIISGMVIMLSFASATSLGISQVVDGLTNVLPASLSGIFVIMSPFGGVFRGDLFICTIVLFILDWLLYRFYKGEQTS